MKDGMTFEEIEAWLEENRPVSPASPAWDWFNNLKYRLGLERTKRSRRMAKAR